MTLRSFLNCSERLRTYASHYISSSPLNLGVLLRFSMCNKVVLPICGPSHLRAFASPLLCNFSPLRLDVFAHSRVCSIASSNVHVFVFICFHSTAAIHLRVRAYLLKSLCKAIFLYTCALRTFVPFHLRACAPTLLCIFAHRHLRINAPMCLLFYILNWLLVFARRRFSGAAREVVSGFSSLLSGMCKRSKHV